ncbi:hypothetical protein JOF47_003759 [Paeniglutamicibacter kerguelensis]|uniref:Uncharacterized protein n=1 Tax=Paeniglutamicibacter kerguelensis TaxID=254788 RepID=A0ABS4XIL2_9MICC|nr:hypothetical protein [Paeniglutamicibacter kerguelensis]
MIAARILTVFVGRHSSASGIWPLRWLGSGDLKI